MVHFHFVRICFLIVGLVSSIILFSCSDTQNSETEKSGLKTETESSKEVGSNPISGIWVIDSITVKERVDMKKYPFNEDILMLSEDGRYSIEDKVYDYTSSGSWEYDESSSVITLHGEEGTEEMILSELHLNRMILSVYNGEDTVKCHYQKRIE